MRSRLSILLALTALAGCDEEPSCEVHVLNSTSQLITVSIDPPDDCAADDEATYRRQCLRTYSALRPGDSSSGDDAATYAGRSWRSGTVEVTALAELGVDDHVASGAAQPGRWFERALTFPVCDPEADDPANRSATIELELLDDDQVNCTVGVTNVSAGDITVVADGDSPLLPTPATELAPGGSFSFIARDAPVNGQAPPDVEVSLSAHNSVTGFPLPVEPATITCGAGHRRAEVGLDMGQLPACDGDLALDLALTGADAAGCEVPWSLDRVGLEVLPWADGEEPCSVDAGSELLSFSGALRVDLSALGCRPEQVTFYIQNSSADLAGQGFGTGGDVFFDQPLGHYESLFFQSSSGVLGAELRSDGGKIYRITVP